MDQCSIKQEKNSRLSISGHECGHGLPCRECNGQNMI